MIIIILNLLIGLSILFYGIYTIDRWLFFKRKKSNKEIIYSEENKTILYKIYSFAMIILCICTLVSVVVDYEQIQFFLIAIFFANIYLLQNENNKLLIDNTTISTAYRTVYFENIESVEILNNSNNKKYRMKVSYKNGKPLVILLIKREVILEVLKEKGIVVKGINQ